MQSPSSVESILISLGVAPAGTGAGDGSVSLPHQFLPVLLDGRVIGGGSVSTLARAASELRRLKVMGGWGSGDGGGMVVGAKGVDPTLEVGWLPPMKGGAGPYPGLYLASEGAR